MRTIHDLTEKLSRLPGLGPRQARRVVQFLLARDASYRKDLAHLIEEVGARAHACVRCGRFDEIPVSTKCRICSDSGRDSKLLILVEHDVDIDAIEASSMYGGYYFVLGGHYTLSKTRSRGPQPRTEELVSLLQKEVPTELIFALAATPEGDYTAAEIASKLRASFPALKLSTLGRGLSVGAELEYADPETLRSALKNRHSESS